MYEAFFGLEKNPFSMAPDPAFLFATPSHEEAIAGLLYCIQRRKGFMVLTGDAGTGKTTVLTTVLRSVASSGTLLSCIVNPCLTSSELLELVLLDFGVDAVPDSKAQRIVELRKILIEAGERNQTSVLVIDEAHQLEPRVLEEIRLLSNFEAPSGKLLQIVLAGQPEFSAILDRNDQRQLKQRVAVRVRLEPLTAEQTPEYIDFRWEKAGGQSPAPFAPAAVEQIIKWSNGIPRIINGICDNALVIAFAEAKRTVNSTHIAEVVRDLNLLQSGAHEAAPLPPPAQSVEALVEGPLALNIPPHQAESGILPTLDRYAPAGPAERRAGWFGLRARSKRSDEQTV